MVEITKILVQKATVTSDLAKPETDQIPLQADEEGRLWVRIPGDTRVTSVLSGSTNGRPIQLPSGGTVIHTAAATGTDQIWLWASNTGSTTAIVTLSWGGSSSSDSLESEVPPNKTVPIATAFAIQNSLEVTAEADTPDVINVAGYVQNIS